MQTDHAALPANGDTTVAAAGWALLLFSLIVVALLVYQLAAGPASVATYGLLVVTGALASAAVVMLRTGTQ